MIQTHTDSSMSALLEYIESTEEPVIVLHVPVTAPPRVMVPVLEAASAEIRLEGSQIALDTLARLQPLFDQMHGNDCAPFAARIAQLRAIVDDE